MASKHLPQLHTLDAADCPVVKVGNLTPGISCFEIPPDTPDIICSKLRFKLLAPKMEGKRFVEIRSTYNISHPRLKKFPLTNYSTYLLEFEVAAYSSSLTHDWQLDYQLVIL